MLSNMNLDNPLSPLVPNQVKTALQTLTTNGNGTNGHHHSHSHRAKFSQLWTKPASSGLPSACDIVDPWIALYYPDLMQAIHCCLAVCGSMSMSGRTKPLSVILEGGSGLGKTAAARLCCPFSADSELRNYIYRSDNFTPRSFVSQAGNRKRSELSSIDLLPRINNKTLITKELSTIFQGKDDTIKENFAVLISVLDGQGYTSDSGTHGKRGYEEAVLFNWIACTTPLSADIHKLMSQLGTRILFWELESQPETIKDTLSQLEDDNAGEAEKKCQSIVEDFLIDFYRQSPIASIPRQSITATREQNQRIAEWTHFLCNARAEIRSERGDNHQYRPISVRSPEGTRKVAFYFYDLAKGHALICGRNYLDDSDMDLIEHVAISSVPYYIRPALKLMREQVIDHNSIASSCGVSLTTAARYAEELQVLKLAKKTQRNLHFMSGNNKGLVLAYADRWSWLNNY